MACGCYKAQSATVSCLPATCRPASLTHHSVQGTFKEYAGKGGFKTQSAASEAFAKHGRNTFEVPTPMFGELLAEQLMAPFFVFQVLCVGLWCLDEYVYALHPPPPPTPRQGSGSTAVHGLKSHPTPPAKALTQGIRGLGSELIEGVGPMRAGCTQAPHAGELQMGGSEREALSGVGSRGTGLMGTLHSRVGPWHGFLPG